MLRYFALGLVTTGLLVSFQLFYFSDISDNKDHREHPSNSFLLNQKTPHGHQFDHSPRSSEQAATASNLEVMTPLNGGEDFVNHPTDHNPAQEQTYNPQAKPSDQQNTEQTIWEEEADAPLTPTRFANKGLNARALKMNTQQLARVRVGSELSLPIPQTGQDYKMTVKEVGQHQNGDKTLKGHLRNQPEYAVVMTKGDNATFATINTPDGSFLLEASKGQGWILASTDLDSLVDPNLVDYLIPEITRQ